MNFSKVSPAGFRAVFGVENYVQGVVDHTLLHLIKVRASMLNGCAFCLNMHTTDALMDGESSQRLFGLAAWHDSSFYDDRERAALALTSRRAACSPGSRTGCWAVGTTPRTCCRKRTSADPPPTAPTWPSRAATSRGW